MLASLALVLCAAPVLVEADTWRCANLPTSVRELGIHGLMTALATPGALP